MTQKTALILGATGGIGGEVAASLSQHGWQINALHRDPASAGSRNRTAAIKWIPGDALNPAGDPNIAVRGFPWPLVTLLSPFVTLFREMREMRYLWAQPLQLRNERLSGVLNSEPRTPLEQAVRTTLTGLGCLQSQAPA
jgi:hypothetical protein